MSSKWDERVPEIRAMAGKKTAREMAAHFGVSLGAMGRVCSQHKISTKIDETTAVIYRQKKIEDLNERERDYRAMVELTRRAWL